MWKEHPQLHCRGSRHPGQPQLRGHLSMLLLTQICYDVGQRVLVVCPLPYLGLSTQLREACPGPDPSPAGPELFSSSTPLGWVGPVL